MADKAKGKHGGRRPNQTGRPKKDKDLPVIPLTHHWRAKIKTGEIIARMNRIATGQLTEVAPSLLAVQVSAGRTLLDKALPSLQSTQLAGHDGGPLTIITKAE